MRGKESARKTIQKKIIFAPFYSSLPCVIYATHHGLERDGEREREEWKKYQRVIKNNLWHWMDDFFVFNNLLIFSGALAGCVCAKGMRNEVEELTIQEEIYEFNRIYYRHSLSPFSFPFFHAS